MISRVVIVAGSDQALWPDINQYLDEHTAWIGVDRGAYRLVKRDIIPVAAIGDFDSLSASELKEVEAVVATMKYSIPEKDDTDTQLGLLYAIEEYPEAEYVLIGGTGGRLDHFLSNLWLPFEPRFQQIIPKLTLQDRQNTITYFQPGTYEVFKEADKKYLAYVCLTPVADLTLIGSKYLLDHHQVDYPLSFAGNEFVTNSASFSFATGMVAVIQSVD